MKFVVGITGASGSVYGLRLIEVLRQAGHEVYGVVTDSGWKVLDYECEMKKADLKQCINQLFENSDISAAIASGSFRVDAMVVAPCSMKTVASIAGGVSDNLLTRAADVTLKEGRPLLLVPRETPMHAIHLENMLKLARLGVKILPACPGFYHRPRTLEALVDMLVGKICDALSVEHQLFQRWQGISK